jgi:hypothetical protein
MPRSTFAYSGQSVRVRWRMGDVIAMPFVAPTGLNQSHQFSVPHPEVFRLQFADGRICAENAAGIDQQDVALLAKAENRASAVRRQYSASHRRPQR